MKIAFGGFYVLRETAELLAQVRFSRLTFCAFKENDGLESPTYAARQPRQVRLAILYGRSTNQDGTDYAGLSGLADAKAQQYSVDLTIGRVSGTAV